MRRTLSLLTLAAVLALPACQQRSEPAGEAPAAAAGQVAEEGLHWYGYADGVAQAAAAGKPMLIDFWTDWCHWCKVMDKDTYSDPEVQRRLAQHFIAVKVDAESKQPQGGPQAPTGEALAQSFQVSSYPTTWFVDSQGGRIAPLASFVPPDQFVVVLDYIASGAYKTQAFQAYQAAQGQGQGQAAAPNP